MNLLLIALQALGLSLLLFLPGYLLLTLLGSNRPAMRLGRPVIHGAVFPRDMDMAGRARGTLRKPAAEGRLSEVLFQSVLVSTLLVSALAFSLAQGGCFSLTLLLVLAAGLLVVFAILLWRRHAPPTLPRPTWADLFPAALLVLGIVLFFHPHEYLLGSGDAGGYVHLGVTIADTGGIVFLDPDLAALDPKVARQELLFPEMPMPGMEARYFHFPVFLIGDWERGQITPQFYHLFPTWIALGYSLLGLRGSLYITPMLGVLAILSVYFAGKQVLGQWAGLLGSLFLSLNMVQVWFSRYPTSEIMTQYLVFSTIYLLTLWLEPSPNPGETDKWGVLAAGTLGALLVTRVDSLVALLPIVLWAVYKLLFRRADLCARWPFFLTLGLALVYFLVYSCRISSHYTLFVLAGLYYYLLYPRTFLVVCGLGLGSLGLVAFLARRGWLRRQERSLRGLSIALLAALAIWGYFIWPAVTPPQTVDYPAWPEPVRFNFENDENLVRLGWYIPPWGMLLGFLGLLEALRREPIRRIAYWLALFLLFGTLYTYHVSDAPVHIHVMRRYVPVVIPTLSLGAGYALQRLGRFGRGGTGPALASVLGAGLLVSLALPTWPLLGHVEYAGTADQIAALAQRFDETSLLLYADVEEGTLIGMPLQYIFHRSGFVLQRVHPDPAGLAAQVRAWEGMGRQVYLIVANGRSRLSPGDFTLTLQDTVRFTLPRLEQTLDRRPARVAEMPLLLEIYRLGVQPETAASGDRFVDVGAADYLFLQEGFWGKEQTPDGRTFRWTQGDAEVLLPGNWFAGPGPFSLSMALGNTRPSGIPPVDLHVHLDDRSLATLTIPPGYQVYTVTVPSELAETLAGQKVVSLHLSCAAWQPSSAGFPDERSLGVWVDWIRLTEAPPR
ncbi:MAG: hypothetical protein ACPL7G_08925 [Chloroflexia bacterium]